MATSYRVSRTIRIDAPPSAVYPHVVDLRRWVDWSPWEGLDPDLERIYTGPEQGAGAGYAWSGNRKAGQGSMTVTEAVEPTRVELDLHFESPFPADNDLCFDLDPEETGQACVVTWTMTGEHRGLMSVVSRVLPMDRLVGKDFEKGLAQLRRLVESTHGGAPA